MISIGKFSKLTGINTKTLIWYDSIGILKPVYVNEESGYRYYSEDSVFDLIQIKYLQSLNFSINEIKNISEDVLKIKSMNWIKRYLIFVIILTP